MYPYRKSQLDIFLALVKEANPGIPPSFDATTIGVSEPAAQPVVAPSVNDTNILIYSRSDSFLGTKRVEYRRLDLGSYFNNQTPLELTIWTSGNSVNILTVMEELNRKLGTNFDVVADSTWAPSTNIAYNTGVTFTAKATSLSYKGSMPVIVRKGKRPLGNIVANNTLAIREFKGGNSFPSNRKPQGEYISYDVDYSSLSLGTTGGGTIVAGNAGFIRLSAFWQEKGYVDLDHTKTHTIFGGLLGLTFSYAKLPHVNFPEANSDKYNYALIISSKEDSWFQGNMIIHYNA